MEKIRFDLSGQWSRSIAWTYICVVCVHSKFCQGEKITCTASRWCVANVAEICNVLLQSRYLWNQVWCHIPQLSNKNISTGSQVVNYVQGWTMGEWQSYWRDSAPHGVCTMHNILERKDDAWLTTSRPSDWKLSSIAPSNQFPISAKTVGDNQYCMSINGFCTYALDHWVHVPQTQ